MERCRTDPPGVSSNQCEAGRLVADLTPLSRSPPHESSPPVPLSAMRRGGTRRRPWPRSRPGSKMEGTCGQEFPVADPFPQLRAALAGQYAIEREDRKSTRLNSSHLVISYAVF